MHSCLYEGQVRHTRSEPVLHRFRYSIFQIYLDLDELDTVFAGRWLWSTKRAALARYFHGRAVDYCEQALTYLTRSVTASLTAGRVD